MFGNWLAYAGEWDRGAALTERALEIEPRHYRPWWLFGIAERHYARGEYGEALEWFRKAFNERNWLSHLPLAYTLPHLGRHEEARAARDRFLARFGRVIEHIEAGREEAATRAFLENVFEYPDGGERTHDFWQYLTR